MSRKYCGNDHSLPPPRALPFVVLKCEPKLLDGPELGIELASALLKLYPEQFHAEKVMDILANRVVYDAITKGEDPHRIALDWQDDLLKFQQLRQKYLIYK